MQQTQLLQQWLKDVITGNGHLQQRLYQVQQQHGLAATEVVAAHGTAGIHTRLQVYVVGYRARLMECLAGSFPVLKKLVGDDMFEAFAYASFCWKPSRSYTLTDLAGNFVAFLQQTKPGDNTYAGMLDLPAEIARVEQARDEVARAAGTEGTNTAPFGDFGSSILGGARFTIPACVRLLALQFPLKSLFNDDNNATQQAWPQPQPSFMVIGRKNFQVTIEEIPEWQYHFLLACQQGSSREEAIRYTAQAVDREEVAILADLYVWWPFLTARGWLLTAL